ncbi:uncharacterized protein BX663DRAFT_548824 [Cokeromyces recurvatus]|uniref:uncharacterized protein n=1 Tax=Cokeromyces recurvatus TaxID=90255 RepID=UPI0022203CAD|nr:uncharacterized protein BX663DRAFT_548824 [Cokeromyces recurvatus]KAI7906666.1 hypothetical protein BX663DRAFT_548824 [Cokeromyces recurvatus]
MTIVLGTFGYSSQPFCIYTFPQLHFCLEEIVAVFCNDNQSLFKQKSKYLLELYKQYPTEFIKHQKEGRILVTSQVCLEIARLLGLYCLAELCKLTLDEIVHGQLAEPLLDTIECRGWEVSYKEQILKDEDSSIYESCKGNEWIFVNENDDRLNMSSSPSLVTLNHVKHISKQPSFKNPTIALLYQWLSTDLLLCGDLSVARQQQAIIETRQRRISFTHKKLPTHTTTTKRKYYQMTSTKIAGNKSQHDRIIKSHDESSRNLHLLATQATQLIHKKPRLPSLKTMLSGLNHHY